MKIKVFHLNGLPEEENTQCTVELTKEGINVEGKAYKTEIDFINVATCEFDGPDVIAEDGMVGLVSVMAGGLVAKMEEDVFRNMMGLQKEDALPEDVTCLVLNYVDVDNSIKKALFLESESLGKAGSVIDLVFKYNEVKPDRARKTEYVEKAEKVEVK